MKKHSYTKLLALTAGAAIAATEAEAGLSDTINEFFTFREEQKELIRPNYTLPPKHVVVPYYDAGEAKVWSDYYTREDLTPQAGMDSATMVMRPGAKVSAHTQPEQQHNPYAAEKSEEYGHFSGHNDRLVNNQPQALGFEAIEQRDHLNRIQNLEGNVYIGEPGNAPHLDHNAGSNIGKKVQIGEPKAKWNEQVHKNYANPRPGDYDYKTSMNTTDVRETYTQRAEEITPRSTGYMPTPKKTYADVQIGTPAGNDLPTEYMVEKNDTLSGISNKDKIYGDWKLWPMIYDANKSQIKDPDLIQPKQRLGIPRGYSETQENQAKQRATAKTAPYSFYDGK